MQILLTFLALLVIGVCGWALIKRYQSHMVLFTAGFVLLVLALLLGNPHFLPKGTSSSGLAFFDIFTTLKAIAVKQTSGIGLLIMAAGGFSAYMHKIGAAGALVRLVVNPLKKIQAPYLVLVGGYFIGQTLVLVIPSAAGLAMLLLVSLFPILVAVGVSRASAASIIGTSAGLTFAPTAGTANLAAKTAGLDPIIYLVQYQLKIAIPVIIIVAICHYFVQKYFDAKNDDQYGEMETVSAPTLNVAPSWYAIFPILPIFLLIIFSKLVMTSIKLDTVSALFMVWFLVVLVEIIRHRSVKKILKDAMEMFQSMGKMFAGIVSLIICAEFFATGLKSTGLIDLLINSAQDFGASTGLMSVVLTGIVSVVTFLTGSGVGAYSSFVSLAPDVAQGIGSTTVQLVTPMQIASGMIRAMSPVAGVIIAVAGACGVSPMSIVRRTSIPMIVGVCASLVLNYLLI